jgi:hypothetical protein
MNLDEEKPIDVSVKVMINQRMLLTSLVGTAGSIIITSLLIYYLASDLIPTMCSIFIGVVLMFFSWYFPLQSPRFLLTKSEIVDIEEEELEELQSIMKPW